MKHRTRVAAVMLAALLAAMGVHARPAGSAGGPGGHGGHGGHGGFHSSGSSSGRGFSHAIGHSFAKLFGVHGKAPSPAHDMTPPPAGTAATPAKAVQVPGTRVVYSSAPGRFHHRPVHEFPFGSRFLFFPPRPGFGFGGCSGFGFPRYNFFYGNDFNCFAGGFLFAPLFIGGFSGSFIGGPAFLPSNDQSLGYVSDDSTAAPRAEALPTQPSDSASAGKVQSQQPVTLLQLRDGSMYGLVDYWVEDGELHYTTTYGGQNSIGFDRIDLEKTVQLNADRGVPFVLRLKTPPR